MSWGSGIGLDEEFDLWVDSTGDIALMSGLAEVEKDLALLMTENLSDSALGQVATPELQSRLRIRVTNILLSDSRVEDVAQVEIVESADSDLLIVEARIQLTDGQSAAVTTL